MARRNVGRFFDSRGRRGFGKAFKRGVGSYKLSRFLNKKEKKYALNTLRKYKPAFGVSARSGNAGYQSQLEKAYGSWRRDTKDPISRSEAKMIKREIERYQRNLEANPNVRRMDSSLWENSQNFGQDPRSYQGHDQPSQSPDSGTIANEAELDYHPDRPGEPPLFNNTEQRDLLDYVRRKPETGADATNETLSDDSPNTIPLYPTDDQDYSENQYRDAA